MLIPPTYAAGAMSTRERTPSPLRRAGCRARLATKEGSGSPGRELYGAVGSNGSTPAQALNAAFNASSNCTQQPCVAAGGWIWSQ